MTELSVVLRSATSAWASTVVEVSLLVSLPAVGSRVPFEATVALLATTVPLATELGTVTWIVIVRLAPGTRPAVETRLRAGPVALQPLVEPVVLKTVPFGRVSLTVNPPVLSDGPLLVTTRL